MRPQVTKNGTGVAEDSVILRAGQSSKSARPRNSAGCRRVIAYAVSDAVPDGDDSHQAACDSSSRNFSPCMASIRRALACQVNLSARVRATARKPS